MKTYLIFIVTCLGIAYICLSNDIDTFKNQYTKEDVVSYPKVKTEIKCPLGHDSIYELPAPTYRMSGNKTDKVWVCSEDYYQYDLKHKFWKRCGEDEKNFAIPLSDFTKMFNIEEKSLSQKNQYSQYYKFKSVQWESVMIRTNLSVDQSFAHIKQILENNKIKFVLETKIELDDKYSYFKGKWKDYEFKVVVGKQIHWDNPSYISCEIKGKDIWETD